MSGLTEIELKQQIDELLNIRDALSQKLRAAQHESEALATAVEALRMAAMNYEEEMGYSVQSEEELAASNSLKHALAATPQQHLRDVRAEAVSKFIEFMHGSSDCQLCSKSLDVAVKYVRYVSDGEVK